MSMRVSNIWATLWKPIINRNLELSSSENENNVPYTGNPQVRFRLWTFHGNNRPQMPFYPFYKRYKRSWM